MSYQVAKLIARIAENLPEMPSDIMQGWIDNPKGLKKFLLGLCLPAGVFERAKLLRRVTSVLLSGAERFVAKDHLTEANVGWTGDNFDRPFKDKVEENVPHTMLAVSRLERASLDAPILAELGDKAEVSLFYLFGLLAKQTKGEDGVLLTNGYANIFYVRGTDGNLWAVHARWVCGDGYWVVEASSVEHPFGWRDGSQFLSRGS